MRSLFCLFFLVSFACVQTFARTHLCPESTVGQFNDQLQKNILAAQDIESKIDESPFVYACKEPNALANRPRTSVFKRTLPAQDIQGHQSIDLLEKIFNKVNDRVTANEFLVGNIQYCINEKPKSGCDEVNQWANDDLPKIIQTARHELAISQQISQYFVSDSFETFMNRPRRDRWDHTDLEVNDQLKVTGSFKKENWEPLTRQEKLVAISALNKHKSENHKIAMQLSRQENLPPGKINELKDQWLFGQRMKHGENYKAIMAQVPFLQYMTKANPKPGEISFAAHQMQKALLQERALMNKLSLALKSARKTGKLDPALLELLNYRNEVEQSLLENPEACKLGASLQFTKENREIGNNLTIMLPVMAASLVVSPAVAVGIGIAAGAGLFVVENNEFEKAKNRELSQVNAGSDAVLNQIAISDLNESDNSRMLQLATVPLGTGALGKLGKFLKVGPEAGLKKALWKK